MLASMTDYFWGPNPAPPPQPRRPGHVLGAAGKALLITAPVVLVLGGLVFAGFIVVLIVGLNSWGSNK
jgi:hypothetical protein